MTYKQQPFLVCDSAVEGSPKFGVVNHGGHGLVDDNFSYRIDGSHFFTENGSEIGRFQGNLAVRSHGSGLGEYTRPGDLGHGGHGFWLQGGGVDSTDNVAIGQSFDGFAFDSTNMPDSTSHFTRGTSHGHLAVFLTANLKDPSIANGRPWVPVSYVPVHMARCVSLACGIGLSSSGGGNVFRKGLVEDCRFVWNASYGYEVALGGGSMTLRNTKIIGTDPKHLARINAVHTRGRQPANDQTGTFVVNPDGGTQAGVYVYVNATNVFTDLDNVTIDGYPIGVFTANIGTMTIRGGYINALRKLDISHPWGGKVVVNGVQFGTTKGEEPEKISLGREYANHIGYVPFDDVSSVQNCELRMPKRFHPFEFVYNGKQVYALTQKADYVPFPGQKWSYGVLDGKTNQQLWEQYRLAIGGRVAPSNLTPSPDIRGGALGPDVSFDLPICPVSTSTFTASEYERLMGRGSTDNPAFPPRYMLDPLPVGTPQKGYVARVTIEGKEYRSEPTDLVPGVNVVPIKVGNVTRHVVVGRPSSRVSKQK